MMDFIIICGWNNYQDSFECLSSVFQFTPNIEVIFVNNGSTDNTPDLRAQFSNYKNFHYVHSDTNKYFSGGYNLGIKETYKYSTNPDDIITILNNDTVVSENWFEELKKGFEEAYKGEEALSNVACPKDKIGYMAPLNTFTCNPVQRSPSKGVIPKEANGNDWGWNKYKYLLTTGSPAVCWAIKRAVWEDIGYLDEQFVGGGFEDTAASIQLANKGYFTYLVRESWIFHKGSKSISKFPNYGQVFYENRLRLEASY